jgi:hypothetical protein
MLSPQTSTSLFLHPSLSTVFYFHLPSFISSPISHFLYLYFPFLSLSLCPLLLLSFYPPFFFLPLSLSLSLSAAISPSPQPPHPPFRVLYITSCLVWAKLAVRPGHKVLTNIEYRAGLASSEILKLLTPPPSLHPASVSSPRTKGAHTRRAVKGGGGQYFR